MEPTVFQALDLYLSTVPAPALVAYAFLGIVAVGLGPFAPAFIAQHVAAVRSAR